MKSDLKIKGFLTIEHRNEAGKLIGLYKIPNGIVNEGLNHILETQFHSGSQVTTWYVGLVDASGWTAWNDVDVMNSHAGWTESTAYTEGTRPQWTCGAAAAREITNASTVDFSINATATMKGIFITSNNAKSGTTGVLWSTAAFSSEVSVGSGDTFKITYTVSG